MSGRLEVDGRRRVVIENVAPQVDGGRFAVKRIVGDTLVVEADVFADGHDECRAVLRWQRVGDAGEWHELDMEPLGNDRWRASFTLTGIGRYRYAVTGRIDRWRTWQHDLRKRVDAGQDVAVELRIGAQIVDATAGRAAKGDAAALRTGASGLTAARALDERFAALVDSYPDRAYDVTVESPLEVVVEPERARFSAWYELFPRSASPDPERHGTFRDVVARLPYVAELGFDVLYLPPIHPIGRQFRKGPNNTALDRSRRPGRAVGDRRTGGRPHDVHPGPGHARRLRRARGAATSARGIEIALDIAFQASPDHPWVTEHPEWFRDAARRHHPVRREPAQEVPGHLPVRLREQRLARRCGRRSTMSSASGSATA